MRTSNIQARFNQAACHYDDLALAQQHAAERLIDRLISKHPNFQAQSILDLGCGTGFVTQALRKHYPNANFILNDFAKDMLKVCQTKFISPNVSYLLGNMDEIPLPKSDLIASNFSLQWSRDIRSCMQRLYQKSKILAFTCLVEGSLATWQAHFPKQQLMHYPKPKDVIDLVHEHDASAHIFMEKFPLKAQTPREFMRYLQQIGASTPLEPTSLKNLRKVLQSKTPIETEYHVLFAILENHEYIYQRK